MPDCSSSSSPPGWVTKRDGRIVPFESEKISRSLFAATEKLGKPDAILARELTDQSLSYLIAEIGNTVPTTAQVAELVAKAVDALGQHALAQKFSDDIRQHTHALGRSCEADRERSGAFFVNPVDRLLQTRPSSVGAGGLARAAGRECFRQFSLREVFARDVVAAHQDSLLWLGGLETPLELTAGALGALQPGERGVFESIERIRRDVGEIIAIDGPEYALAFTSGAHDESRADYAREVHIGLRATGLRAVVNLNCASPPSWTRDFTGDSIFNEPSHPSRPEGVAEHADGLLEQFLRLSTRSRVRIDWHLTRRDFTDTGRLARVARRAVDETAVTFVFDRSQAPVALAEGIDRQRPHLLLSVGLNLSVLLERSTGEKNESRFMQRLESLTRLAVSAGLQKREFLVRQARRLDAKSGPPANARLLVIPVGLDPVARRLSGSGLSERSDGLEWGVRVLERLIRVIADEGSGHDLETGVDSASHFRSGPDDNGSTDEWSGNHWTAGLTSWDPEAEVPRQLEAAGRLHARAGAGTTTVHIPDNMATEEVVSFLRQAWENTAITRLRFVSQGPPSRQLTAPWDREP